MKQESKHILARNLTIKRSNRHKLSIGSCYGFDPLVNLGKMKSWNYMMRRFFIIFVLCVFLLYFFCLFFMYYSWMLGQSF